MCSRISARFALAAALSLWGIGQGGAQDFPNRQIALVIGLAPGGITDVSSRIYAEAVSRNVGQRLIVENRPGAGGAVGATAVQNAPPDGYTLITFSGSQHTTIAAIQPVSYEPLKGFQPITLMFRLPAVLVVPAESPAKTVAELLEYGKKKSGGLNFGSPGVGTPSHLLAAKIGLVTKTPIEMVHYRGGAPLIADLLTGRVDFAFSSYTAARSNVESGKLRIIAIDAEKRLSTLPNVPTLTEAGLGAEKIADWFGLAAPAGTPTPVVQKLNAEFIKASHDPELVRRLTENGTLIATSTPDQMATMLADEFKNMQELVKTLGLRTQ